MEILIAVLMIFVTTLTIGSLIHEDRIKDLECKPGAKTPEDLNIKYDVTSFAMERIEKLEKAIFVKDYLVEVGEAKGDELILKSEAVEIKKSIKETYTEHILFIGTMKLGTGRFETKIFHTSKENYKNHKPLIDEWAKEAKK